MTNESINIIDSIVEYRKKAGLTQQQLADATGLTQSVIARLESKKVSPTLDTLIRVLTPLNYKINIKKV